MLLRSTRVVLPDGERPASINVENGVVTSIDRSASLSGERQVETFDFGDLVISAGIVDTHVHVNEPGRTDWEGFNTATRAAAAGGVTTIVDMPLNSIPATTTVAALEAKRAAARGQCHVDVGFWGGVVPGNAGDLDGLVDAGVRGFKCFLVPSGVDEFQHVTEADLRQAMPMLARRKVPLLVHAELPQFLRAADVARGGSDVARAFQASDPGVYSWYLATRPPDSEVAAIQMMIRLAAEFGARTHIVHVAAAEAVAEIARAKANGVPITAETCPHYLTCAAEDIPDGATEFKCAPPIRERRHQTALWDGLRAGTLDLVATDHSPAPPTLKCPGDFMRAWGGIASLELSLAAVWTGLVSGRGELNADRSPERLALHRSALVHWMSERPAALAGLSRRKGRIAPGFDADLVVWDPDDEFTVDAVSLQQRHKLTPYAGRRLRGRVRTTFLRGVRVWDEGAAVSLSEGRLL